MIKPLIYHFFLLLSGLAWDDQQQGGLGAGDGGARLTLSLYAEGGQVEQAGLVLDKDEEQLLAR